MNFTRQTFAILTIGAILALSAALPATADQQSAAKEFIPVALPTGAKVFIAPMEWNLDSFVVAEVRRQGLPVQFVAHPEDADFVMAGLSESLGSRMISPGHYIQVKIITAGTGEQVWTAETSDYATLFGRLRSHGSGRAARAIVTKLHHRFFKSVR